jgi:hypothetical protein
MIIRNGCMEVLGLMTRNGKLRFQISEVNIDIDYVLKCVIERTDLTSDKGRKELARKIFDRAFEGKLRKDNWEETCKELGIGRGQYYNILRDLKNAGILGWDGHEKSFRPSYRFSRHINQIGGTYYNYLQSKGIIDKGGA